MCYRNDFCGTRRRVEWMLTPLLLVPPPSPPQSSQVVQSAALFAGMKSESPKSVLLSSVYNVL